MEANDTYKDKVKNYFYLEDWNEDMFLQPDEFKRFYVKAIPNTPLRLSDPKFIWDGAFRLFD